jgi:hypothetical protein
MADSEAARNPGLNEALERCLHWTAPARFPGMERIIRIYASHRDADDADRAALEGMPSQERLDRALALHARHREALGDAGQGFARVARAVRFDRS